MQHHRANTPAYEIWVDAAPSNNGKGKVSYQRALSAAAAAEVSAPISSRDVELEIVYATARARAQRLDADNVNKSTLDGLKQVLYGDDSQVRSVKCTIIEKGTPAFLSARAEHIGRILESGNQDIVLVLMYSDQRLSELGGESVVAAQRLARWERTRSRPK